MSDVKPARAGGDRREQILAAALDLFAAHGLEHVTTRTIARAVGISQPSLYAHFASADEIAVELCVRAFERLRARMIAARDGGGDDAARMMRLGREYVRFGLEEPAAYRVAFMLEKPGGRGPAHDRARAAGLASFAVMRDYVADLRGGTDASIEVVAQTGWASLHGLVALLLARPDFPWAEADVLIDAQVAAVREAVLRGQDVG